MLPNGSTYKPIGIWRVNGSYPLLNLETLQQMPIGFSVNLSIAS
jgi:hypothetical protein